MVVTYFEIGRRIIEKEQQGAKRAQYGKKVLQGLSDYLTVRLGKGYSDIYLQKHPAMQGAVKYEYILEIKYAKTDATEADVAAKFADAEMQIQKYKKDPRFANRNNLKLVAPRSREEIADFLGKTQYYAMKAFVNPLVESGQLKMTVPEKPKSKRQRYCSD